MSDIRVSVAPYNAPNPGPDNLPAFVPYACMQLSSPFTVRFKTVVQEDYVSKTEDKDRKSRKSAGVVTQLPASDSNEDSVGVIATYGSTGDDEIVITVTLNASGRLLGLALERCAETPRLLMQVIGLSVPFCPYLTSLSLRLCGLDGTVLYEISKILPQSHITDLCLDDSPIVPEERCYYRLLEQSSKLRSLSLARCSLTDDDCALLVSKMTYPMPASKTLLMLNLTNNFITNAGARSIGNCLRSNRTLQYLNLSGNQIGDTGAAEIFNSLADFPLTAEEIMKKRQRHMEFLKIHQEVFKKHYKELIDVMTEKALDDVSRSSKRRGGESRVKTSAFMQLHKGRRSSRDIIVAKAQTMADESVGSYNDPFSSEETFFRANYRYCIGNMSLCYLNLAYNYLSYLSLKKLVEVVKYQSTVAKSSGTGLLQVQLIGNDLPECLEIFLLEHWLEDALTARTARSQTPRRDRIKPKK